MCFDFSSELDKEDAEKLFIFTVLIFLLVEYILLFPLVDNIRYYNNELLVTFLYVLTYSFECIILTSIFVRRLKALKVNNALISLVPAMFVISSIPFSAHERWRSKFFDDFGYFVSRLLTEDAGDSTISLALLIISFIIICAVLFKSNSKK